MAEYTTRNVLNLEIHNLPSRERFEQLKAEGKLDPNALYFTPDETNDIFTEATNMVAEAFSVAASMMPPVLTHAWFDHEVDNMSWLCADTFSWHNYDPYKVAYEHLANDINGKILQSETVNDITIQFYLADDGHKICLPDQESNLVALYEATGTAWYYLLDQTNQQFKLPRTKEQGIKEVYNGSDGIVILSNGLVIQSKPNRSGSTWTPNMSLVDSTRPVGASAASYGSVYAGERTMYFGTEWTGGKFISHAASNDAGASGTLYGATLISYATDEQISAFLGRDFRSSFPDKRLYFYVGHFEQDAVEQTAGINAETLSKKIDLPADKTQADVDFVVSSQLPTADNGYTWYRKYKSGWVEQGGLSTGTGTRNVTLPIEMASSNYNISAMATRANADAITAAGYGTRTTTKFSMQVSTVNQGSYTWNSAANVIWQVCGMAA